MTTQRVEVAPGRFVGDGQPTFVIAEAGVNHNGDAGLARALVDVAAEAGADAVKFQTFAADRLVSPSAPKAEYQLQTTDPGESQLAMLKALELSPELHEELREHCRSRGILFLSTPFDEKSVGFLEEFGVSAFKLGSGEVTNLPLIRRVAATGKPLILSTGMAYLGEVDAAQRAFSEAGGRGLILLQCVSNYPSEPADANLRVMELMSQAFRVPVGFSDHTRGLEVSLAAVALGAAVIERHFTLDQNLPGPDQRFSLEPDSLRALVRGIRDVEQALGTGLKQPAESELENRRIVRRSLAAAQDLPSGVTLSAEMLMPLRPGTGISPDLIEALVGRRTRRALERGELVGWEDLA
jgi:N-acetylneuraminate synthase